jgi:hypothetical protein
VEIKIQRQRITTFMEYLESEVCELDLLEGADHWDERPWDLSRRLAAGTIKWLEAGGDINA